MAEFVHEEESNVVSKLYGEGKPHVVELLYQKEPHAEAKLYREEVPCAAGLLSIEKSRVARLMHGGKL